MRNACAGGIEGIAFVQVVGIEKGDVLFLDVKCGPVACAGCAAVAGHVQQFDFFWMLFCELLGDEATVVGGVVIDNPNAADSGLHERAVNGFGEGIGGVVAWDDDGDAGCIHGGFRGDMGVLIQTIDAE